ncbi:MAG: hypothetical protein K2I28_00275 [Muribaculaceae bacterium]|nr:hypothetical protein [Muribaculaceae bacterium]
MTISNSTRCALIYALIILALICLAGEANPGPYENLVFVILKILGSLFAYAAYRLWLAGSEN